MSTLKVNAIKNLANQEPFGLTLMTPVTASGTSVDFTGIPSWAKRITVMFSGMSTNAANPFLIQIGSGSFNTTGYISGSAYSTSSGVSRITSTFGFAVAVNTAVSTISGRTTITLLSGNTYVNSGVVNNDGGNVTNMCGGTVSLSGVLDRLRIIASSTGSPADTFDAGTINVMYE